MNAHELAKYLRYDAETGLLFWLERPASMFSDGVHSAEHSAKIWNNKYAGKVAFTNVNRGGYRKGCLLGRTYIAHKVIWALVHGEWPPSGMDIDHINGIKTDNRSANLRLATRAENMRNRGARRGRKFCGTSFDVRTSRWRARCQANGHLLERGGFATEADAALAYDKIAKALHGPFAKPNFEEAS